MASKGVQITRQVKPLLSVNEREARIRVFQLYKAWTRQLPDTIEQYTLPVTEKEAQQCLKENFMKNAHVKDIRVIDMLIIKGQQDLRENIEMWAYDHHIMSKFLKETHTEKPKDFMSKFLSGSD